jgi:hypothetical protein
MAGRVQVSALRHILFATWLMSCCALAQDARSEDSCFFATSAGNRVIPVCADEDPLNLGKDAKLAKVMQAFGIVPSHVRFKGCKGLLFSATPDPNAPGAGRYLVRYPVEVGDDYLAPTTHELAHVLQMSLEGGSEALWKSRKGESKRIELEADFLTGVVFKQVLPDARLTDFQNNILLTGLFEEERADAHGTSSQRTAAFRTGYFLQREEKDIPDLRTAARYFQANEYGGLVR